MQLSKKKKTKEKYFCLLKVKQTSKPVSSVFAAMR